MKTKPPRVIRSVIRYVMIVIVFLFIVAPTEILAAYYIKQLATSNAHLSEFSEGGRQLNDKGQVVWYRPIVIGGNYFYQIFFYDGITTKQITNDTNNNHFSLDLNNNGEFVWRSEFDDKIKLYKDGVIKSLNPVRLSRRPRINNHGDVVWYTIFDSFYHQSEIFLYNSNNNNVQQITNNGDCNIYPRINDNGDIAWCGRPYEIIDDLYCDIQYLWGIYLYRLEAQNRICEGYANCKGLNYSNLNNNCQFAFKIGNKLSLYNGNNIIDIPTYPNFGVVPPLYLNNNGSVVWRGAMVGADEIFLFDGTIVKKLSGNNNQKYGPNINDVGQVVWGEKIYIDNNRYCYKIYLYNNGTITQVCEKYDAEGVRNLQINNNSEIVWEDNSGYGGTIFLAVPINQPIISTSVTFLTNTSKRRVNAPSQSFEVWNCGDGTLNFQITSDVNWLSCTPNSGISTGNHVNITMNYLTKNLDYGIYNANLIITDANAINNPVNIPVTLTITESSLNGALDNNALTFITGGNASWFPQTTYYYYGGSAAQSGHIGDNQSSSLQTTLEGPGTLSFYWKVSSESNADYLELYQDGSLKSRIGGDIDWGMQNLTIPKGTHIIKWVYRKDGNISIGNDCGWVDKIVYTQYKHSIIPSLELLLLE